MQLAFSPQESAAVTPPAEAWRDHQHQDPISHVLDRPTDRLDEGMLSRHFGADLTMALYDLTCTIIQNFSATLC